MRRLGAQGDLSWLPTVLVLVVVLLAGSRLIYLSVQHHAALAREKAATVAASFAGKIEPQLQKLAAAAARQAESTQASGADTPEPLESEPQAPNTFWMTADDRVSSSRPAEAATASGIASEWKSAESARAVPASAILGPLRLGSVWLVAARHPIAAPAGGEAQSRGYSMAYTDLDELIAGSHLARLADMGYEFELSQVEPRSARSRSFVGSNTELLTDAVPAIIRLPTAAAIPGSYLQVAIRPRNGWYPTTLLASEIGLLAFLAWLLAFGTHDLSHALQRSRAALGAARRRLHAINQQLAGEMQQRLNLQKTFDHARFHDAFTGLPNRRYFMDQLDRALRDVRTKRRQRIAVIIVDIARFKLINDMLGHTAGDELMVQAARRFEKSTSSFRSRARTLERRSVCLVAIGHRLHRSGLEYCRTSSGGIAHAGRVAPPPARRRGQRRRHLRDSGQQRAEDVVREADIALSVAKRQRGREDRCLYAQHGRTGCESRQPRGRPARRGGKAASCGCCSSRSSICAPDKMVGAEALLRWRHPVEGVLAPDRFLRIAEEAGLMVPITRWIILRVVRVAGEWLRRLPANDKFFISINLSPTAVRDPGLSEFVASMLRETQLPPAVLKFELTEAALISNVGAARETLEQLHAMGIQLMLDDFGTGYSSLSYLQLFPFDFVKIDRPFVNRTSSDRANTGNDGCDGANGEQFESDGDCGNHRDRGGRPRL